MSENDSGRFIGVIEDAFKRTSRNGNKYIKLTISDERGRYDAMLLNSRRGNKYDRYMERGNDVPKKNNIVILYGSKGEDILFLDNLKIMDEKIYMKLSEIR